MEELLRFLGRLLREHPYLVLILLAWLASIAGSLRTAAKKARQRAEQAARRQQGPAPVRRPAEDSAEAIAREMRRILGQAEAEPHAGDVAARSEGLRSESQRAGARPEAPRPEPLRREPLQRDALRPEPQRRPPPLPEVVLERSEGDRGPTPLQASVAQRRLQVQVAPHVGDAIAQRHMGRAGMAGAPGLGSLGGRVAAGAHVAAGRRRYQLDDLAHLVVLAEILGPPLALRRPGERVG